MPLAFAVVSPHPPLLVPELAGRASGELDDLRAACDVAVARLAGAAPDLVVIVGAAAVTRAYLPTATGSFAGFGVPLPVVLDGLSDLSADRLPLSLTVGAWLSGRCADLPRRSAQSVAADLPVGACAALGASIAGRAARVGLLVMGDGSACRGDRSPGYADPRAEAFDASVTGALAAGDPGALLDLDAGLAAALLTAGRAPWQVLAGAAAGSPWIGEVTYDRAPYGVQYTVATWRPA